MGLYQNRRVVALGVGMGPPNSNSFQILNVCFGSAGRRAADGPGQMTEIYRRNYSNRIFLRAEPSRGTTGGPLPIHSMNSFIWRLFWDGKQKGSVGWFWFCSSALIPCNACSIYRYKVDSTSIQKH